jgi:hypothetical protein
MKGMNNMKTKILFCTLTVALSVLAGVSFAEVNVPTVEFSGFADILWRVDEDDGEGEDFFIGQAEIDLATNLDGVINLEMAVAYDADAGSFGLGALVMDLALLGEDEGSLHHSDVIQNAGLLIGQMDVPFGIDWLFYPSIDRYLITGPLAVSGTHDGWNDLGVAAYIETSGFNAVIYRFNGSGYEAPFVPGDSASGDAGCAWGSRVGLHTVLPNIEIGTSFASIITGDGDQSSTLLGFDAQWATGAFSAKGEYIIQKIGLDTAHELEHKGSYIEGMYHSGRFFVLSRYGLFTPEGSDFLEESRVCLGAGYVIQDGGELRIEHQISIDNAPEQTMAQFVVAF